MGKDLHHSIRPFIENALKGHNKVLALEPVELEDFYAYRIRRKNGMSDVMLVLSDDYYFSFMSLYSKPDILKDGGFILIAKPEAENHFESIPEEKLIVGKLKVLFGALNREEYWNYVPPEKE